LIHFLNFILKELNLLREDQFRFKEVQSSTHALIRLKNALLGFNKNAETLNLFLDTVKPFDKVQATGAL